MSCDNKPTRPFCWQHKDSLRHIRECLDCEGTVSSGLLVYMALTEVASDRKLSSFDTTRSYIASKCGLETKTVGRRMRDLREIGLINYPDQQGLKVPYRVTINLDGNSVPYDGNSVPYDGNQLVPRMIPSLEECREECLEQRNKEGASAPFSFSFESKGKTVTVSLPEHLDTPDVRQCLTQWIDYNKEKRRHIVAQQLELTLETLSQTTPQQACRLVRKAIGAGWSAVYLDDDAQKQQAQPQDAGAAERKQQKLELDTKEAQLGWMLRDYTVKDESGQAQWTESATASVKRDIRNLKREIEQLRMTVQSTNGIRLEQEQRDVRSAAEVMKEVQL